VMKKEDFEAKELKTNTLLGTYHAVLPYI
jgi:hypothetical protein